MLDQESLPRIVHKMQNYFFAVSFLIEDAQDKIVIPKTMNGKAIDNSLREHFKFAKEWAESSDQSQLVFKKTAEVGLEVLNILNSEQFPDNYSDLITKFTDLHTECERCFTEYTKLNT